MSRQSNRKIKREILEERVKFFMNKQIQNNNLNFPKQKNNNNKNKKLSVTIKEGLINKEKEDKKGKKKIIIIILTHIIKKNLTLVH